jgi:methylase of polypeptide subunit release factors
MDRPEGQPPLLARNGVGLDVLVGSVLDLGAGCGIQALLAARHADRVVASDLNPRAVGIAAFNAALNEVAVDCVEGDLFESCPASVSTWSSRTRPS